MSALGSPGALLVDLSRLDSNKYKTLIDHKKRFDYTSISLISDAEISDGRVIDEFGEVAVKRLEQPYRRDFSEDDIAQIISSYQSENATTIDLAEQFGCSKGTINKLLREHGVTVTKAKAQAKLDDTLVIAMYEEQHTMEEIAKHFGVSSYTVNKCLHRNGVKIRSRWDYVNK